MAELIQIKPRTVWLNPEMVVRVDYDATLKRLEIEMVNPDLSLMHECDHKEAHRILHDLGFPVQWSVPK